jgi:hypothetical protein
MLDYCGEVEFYPIDGDNDCYDSYTPNFSKADFPSSPKRSEKYFMPNHNYYDVWRKFDRIIERATCYSILRANVWYNIPKKIVREIKDNQMLVYRPVFNKICNPPG